VANNNQEDGEITKMLFCLFHSRVMFMGCQISMNKTDLNWHDIHLIHCSEADSICHSILNSTIEYSPIEHSICCHL